ncbi:MAG: nuclear transport factor 2 family protein [bacterium]|nr:nuclear transport factor 2 family protein [bacterium]
MDRETMVRNLFELMNEQNLDGLEQLMTPDVDLLFPKSRPWIGRSSVLKFMKVLFRRFGDLVFDVRQVIVQGDDLCVHWVNHGHRANGEEYRNEGVTLCRCEGDRFRLLNDFFKDTEIF